jgi:hypothetical protein
MPIFSQLKYNNYIPQYVGAPLDEYLAASTAVQDRYNQVTEGYSLIGELADTLQASPLEGDKLAKTNLVKQVSGSIEEAAKKGNFDTMQNEMRSLAKQYSKQAAPIKENLARFSAAEKAILDAKLPQNHQNYLLKNLRSKEGLTFDEDGLPQYLQADPFAENVNLPEIYEKYINDYKSDKAPTGVYAVKDPNTGLTEYFANGTNERVDANEVRGGLQLLALSDPKVQQYIMQDAASNGVEIKNSNEFVEYAAPLMEAFTQKAAFDKKDIEFKLGEAGRFRTRKKEEEIGEGFTFDINWGVPARQGVATPSDLRNTDKKLTESRQGAVDEFNKFLINNGDTIDPLTGKSKSGIDYSEEVDLYNQRLDSVDAQKWELKEIENQAKRDAGLPANYTPNQKVLDQAQAAYDEVMASAIGPGNQRSGGDDPGRIEARKQDAQKAYNKVIDTSNDPNLRAYRTALAKNAKDRTDVKGITTFGKGLRAEMDVIGDRVLAGDWGFVKAKNVATGAELGDLSEYGTATESIGWGITNGQVELVFRTGERDGTKFIPSQNKISFTAPPELVEHLTKKGYIDPMDLDISTQIGSFGGKVNVGNLKADVEIKRNAQTGPADVVVVLNDGKKRVAFPSEGAAVKFLSNLARAVNGN